MIRVDSNELRTTAYTMQQAAKRLEDAEDTIYNISLRMAEENTVFEPHVEALYRHAKNLQEYAEFARLLAKALEESAEEYEEAEQQITGQTSSMIISAPRGTAAEIVNQRPVAKLKTVEPAEINHAFQLLIAPLMKT